MNIYHHRPKTLKLLALLFGFLVAASQCFAEEKKKEKKILILIIASDNYPVYSEFQKSWRSYMHSDPEHFEAYFIKGNPQLPMTTKIDGDIIWSKTVEGYPHETPGIINKTLSSMEALLPRIQNEFDYVIRTNLSAFYIYPRLLKFIETLPTTRCYCGDNTGGDSIIGSGAGIIMSKDLVQMLVENKTLLLSKPKEPDDCIIGFFFKKHGIHLQRHFKINIDSLEQWNQIKAYFPEDIFQVRVKTNTADNYLRLPDDMIVHQELFDIFYSEKKETIPKQVIKCASEARPDQSNLSLVQVNK